MEVTNNFIIGFLGIFFTILGGEIVVNNAKSLAKSLKISEFLIGLTVLSIGTSLPEIFTSIISSTKILFYGQDIETLSGIAVGTNIGSDIIQITLITGLSGLIGNIYTTKKFLLRDYFVMFVSTILLYIFSLNGYISRFEGMFLCTGYILYLRHIISTDNRGNTEENSYKDINLKKLIYLLLGLAILIISANFVLDSAIFLSDHYKISGSLIGTLLIGVCTALPEFTTSVIALTKNSSGLSLGTLIGSNITNPTLALGLGAIISGYYVDTTIINFDLPYRITIYILIFFLFWNGFKLNKIEACILIVLYIIYFSSRLLI